MRNAGARSTRRSRSGSSSPSTRAIGRRSCSRISVSSDSRNTRPSSGSLRNAVTKPTTKHDFGPNMLVRHLAAGTLRDRRAGRRSPAARRSALARLHRGDDELLLRRPAPVDRRQPDVGPVGDVLHPQVVVADLVEQLARGVEDQRLPVGLPPAAPRPRDRTSERRVGLGFRHGVHRRCLPNIPRVFLIGTLDFRIVARHGETINSGNDRFRSAREPGSPEVPMSQTLISAPHGARAGADLARPAHRRARHHVAWPSCSSWPASR